MAFELTRFGIAEDDLPLTWETQSLGTLAFFNLEKIGRNYAHDVIQYLDIGNVTKGAVGAPLRVHLQDAPSRAQRIVRDNDTIISTVRPGNRAFAFLREPPVNLIVSTGFAVLRAKPRVNARFIYYLSTCDVIIDYLATVAEEKSAYPSVIPSDIAECVVPVPPESEQRAIAHILGTLDDKIELNRRMSATCEAIARAVFKDWFVDFGPTRAKQEGRDPGLPPDLAALFPDRLVETEHGHVPEGWEVSMIGNEVQIVGGSTPSTKDPSFWGGKISWATPKDLSPLSAPILLSTERRITEAGLTKIGSGLLPVGTVLLSSRAPIGYMAIAQIPVAVNQGFIAMVCKKRLSNIFIWLWTQTNMETIRQNANGSTFQEISKANFRPIEVTVATSELLRTFEKSVRHLFDRIVANEKENRTLSALRDTLLPKLISGEIRVKDAERHIGEAT